ncbi:MAG: DUF3999 family protein [Deltaproteobacteria bacterium]|nr:DUF3999 family protein [Deltaproteobacteria bacterium]
MRFRFRVVFSVVVACLSSGVTAHAAMSSAVRYERPLQIEHAGPQKIAVDVPLLSGAAVGLRDVRFYDAAGAEVQYLVIPPSVPRSEWRAAPALPIAATKEQSGFELDLGDLVFVNALRIEGIAAPFLKRCRLEGSGDRAHWTLLVEEQSLFDLPAEQLQLLTLEFPAGEFRYLRVTWDDTASARVSPPTQTFVQLPLQKDAPVPVHVPLGVERHEAVRGTSRFRLRLPGPQLPVAAIALTVAEATLLRDARVTEAYFTGDRIVPTELGHAQLRKVQQGDASAAALTIPITDPRETELELVVDDGDNPPLQLIAAMAVLKPVPWIYLEAAAPGTLMARFGDSKALAPNYDLEARREAIDADRTIAVVWGERRELVVAMPPAVSPEVGTTIGGALATTGFRFQRMIDDVGAGMNALRIDLAVLAHSRTAAEWRIVDASGRQVPYLLEQLDAPLAVAIVPQRMDIAADDARPHVSRYAVELPYASLPSGHLVVETSARVFRRFVRVVADRMPPDPRQRSQEIEVARWFWSHADAETAAPPVRLALPAAVGTQRMTLEIEEGDNSPLPLTAVRFETTAYRVRFFAATPQPLRLLYGNAAVPAPHYDLALLADVLMGRAAHEPHLAPEAEGGDARSVSTAPSMYLFWSVLIVTALGLALLFIRLLRKNGPPKPAAG